jgi:hypothetical protein
MTLSREELQSVSAKNALPGLTLWPSDPKAPVCTENLNPDVVPTTLDHVLGDARLRDIKPELEQFAVDARRSPKRVLDAHPPDQRTEVRLDLRPPSQ